MDINILYEGIKFMILGMSTVFVFLAVLIIMMNILSYIIDRFFPELKHTTAIVAPAQKDNKKIVAAITAAVMQYRKERGL
jgi:oxaloacetate decarboxylase gamma subunit